MSRIAMVDGVLMRLHSVEVVSLEEAEKLAADLRDDLTHLEALIAEARQRLEPQAAQETPAPAPAEVPTPTAEPEQPVEQPAPVEPTPTPEQPAPAQPEAPVEPAAPEQSAPAEAPAEPVVLQ